MYNKNNKSDITAKEAYVKELQKKGFSARITKAPADITAEKDGQPWFFEIKKTTKECENVFRNEYKAVDPDISVRVEPVPFRS